MSTDTSPTLAEKIRALKKDDGGPAHCEYDVGYKTGWHCALDAAAALAAPEAAPATDAAGDEAKLEEMVAAINGGIDEQDGLYSCQHCNQTYSTVGDRTEPTPLCGACALIAAEMLPDVVAERDAARAELAAVREAQGWVSVKERLPDDDAEVIVWMPGVSGIDVARHIGNYWQNYNWHNDVEDGTESAPTFWRPLPPSPEGQQ